ncbi:MAG: tRNA (adenosine(37)-N6)-dimethylallyltransferase MiaA [Rhodoglobus sp.]
MLPLVVIVGATGTGKSELSLELAVSLLERGVAAEIVNADAMQLYRGMDIGTAKLPVAQRRNITHHMLDVIDPAEESSVADYQREARKTIHAIEGRNAVPILVGGSGLYVSSVIQDFHFPATDPEIRSSLEAELEKSGPRFLYERLHQRDAAAAAAIGPHNGRRLVRALEVIEITGEPFGSGLPENSPPWRETVTIGVQAQREALVPLLEERVRGMWAGGILDEVRELRRTPLGLTASRAIGYAQAIEQLDGGINERTAIDQTAALTRRYARRQVSWFRRYRDAHWLQHDDPARHMRAFALAVRQN